MQFQKGFRKFLDQKLQKQFKFTRNLSNLINYVIEINETVGTEEGLTKSVWEEMNADGIVSDDTEVYRLVYFGGVEHSIRKEVWPYLLGHYSFGSTVEERAELDQSTHNYYETTMSEWLAVEAIVRQRDKEKTAHAVAKLSSESGSGDKTKGVHLDGEMENDVFEENVYSDISDVEGFDDNDANHIKELPLDPKNPTSPSDTEPQTEEEEKKVMQLEVGGESAGGSNKSSPTASSYETVGAEFIEFSDPNLSKLQSPSTDKEEEEDTVCGETSAHVIVTNASIDVANLPEKEKTSDPMSPLPEETGQNSLDALQEPKSACVSPASSNGGIYSVRNSN